MKGLTGSFDVTRSAGRLFLPILVFFVLPGILAIAPVQAGNVTADVSAFAGLPPPAFPWPLFQPIFSAGGGGPSSPPPSAPAFQRSDSGHLVIDSRTGLMWQDYMLSFRDEAGGIAYCADQTLDGYVNWRLGTLNELKDFFKRVYADPGFDLNNWGTFSGCTANVAIGGYVRTPAGAAAYGGETGDPINFSGGAAARCVR